MNKIKRVVIHCSASSFGDVETFRRYHVNGNGWRDIGYNGVILNGYRKLNGDYKSEEIGAFEEGRALDFSAYIESDERGAHALGYNHDSVGICMVGNTKFHWQQIQTALTICKIFNAITIGNDIEIIGHYESVRSGGKTCPNIDMDIFRKVYEKDNYSEKIIKKKFKKCLIN